MASVFLSTKEIAAIEAASELCKDKKALVSALTSIIAKYEKSISRRRVLTFTALADVANEVLGANNWSVENYNSVNEMLARTEVSLIHLRMFIEWIQANKTRPWVLSDYLPGLRQFVRDLNKNKTEIHSVESLTGVIEDL